MDTIDDRVRIGTCTRCGGTDKLVISSDLIEQNGPGHWLCAACLAKLHDTLCGVERIELPRERPQSWVEQLRDTRDLPPEEVHRDEP